MPLSKAHGEPELAYALNEQVRDNFSQGGLCLHAMTLPPKRPGWATWLQWTVFLLALPLKTSLLRTEKKIEREISGMALVAPLCFSVCSASDFVASS